MKVTTYVQEIADRFVQLAKNSSPEAIDELKQALEVRDGGTHEKHLIPYLACRALIYKGVAGIEALAEILPRAPGHIYPMAILSSLWRAGEGEFASSAFGIETEIEIFNEPIDDGVRRIAKEKFVAFLDECRTDPESFDQLINLLYHEGLRSAMDPGPNERFHQAVFKVFSDSTLTISDQLLDQFGELLQTDAREEEYHKFLASNPVFLNPLASQLISKHKLGDDFITDYVLETLTGDYIAVEIEKPSDAIFTRSNDFTCEFTHAFGQTIDFIEWIEQNIAYAQKKLPGIAAPRGLVVIGRRSVLTQRQLDKLRRFNKNSSAVEAVTFEDLLLKAKSLQKNIRRRVGFLPTQPALSGAPKQSDARSGSVSSTST